ncbi:proton-conducting transporter membrane subunit [Sphingomonas sp. S1-29]|uniref:proton-conducting transporter transmembrane domain-containing protein n=1 Tax=Sphingomonas sp. S1-29 TaxID=2991074 RepID=UPI002240B7BD|nr:proton-conducting transporter membrane subunit [Sphingomonas sp. S1-29]UZK68832.1 proton-conducting transporter membrane subunit [Sphingomonas sp. S1-29]
MTDALLLIAPVLLPLAGAAIVTLLRSCPRAGEALAFAVTAATAAMALALHLRAIDGTMLAVTMFGGWTNGFGIGFAGRLPGTALVLASTVVALAVALFGNAEIGPRRRRAGHDALALAMLGAVNGAFLTTDLFNLYVWFELALVAAVALVTLDRRENQIGGAIRYIAFGTSGATAILMGIGLLYGETGTLDLAALARALADRPPSVATAAAAALLLGGFALKSGLVPFHVWLPASYAPAPLTAAALFAGLLTKMGFYALLLLFAGVFGIADGHVGAAQLLPWFGWIGAATMLVGALCALAQTDIRRLLGYHVLAQVGYMMAGLSVGTREGVIAAVFYMLHSMIVQANLFLGAGAVRRATGSWDLARTGGMIRSNPVFAFLFAVPMLSLAGIPPMSGFWAKMLVIRASLDGGAPWIAAAALAAALLTIISVGSLWSESCWKSLRDRRVRRVPPAMLGGMALLSLATLAIGLMPEPVVITAQLSANALLGLAP